MMLNAVALADMPSVELHCNPNSCSCISVGAAPAKYFVRDKPGHRPTGLKRTDVKYIHQRKHPEFACATCRSRHSRLLKNTRDWNIGKKYED